eukprot:CAMPEP_0182461810 /NCGR_PEP_ID=MMETSP1319-20130603/6281_1 /TAXON_ID=172717 /ORGANISM="Bolidomonas pacifica, Strain RCC208" /LENGTH=123 /DNA_ID=CAMNT_0024661153 /DNA_START=55 /DNA_END=427 /DNA_ORIENTATION=-
MTTSSSQNFPSLLTGLEVGSHEQLESLIRLNLERRHLPLPVLVPELVVAVPDSLLKHGGPDLGQVHLGGLGLGELTRQHCPECAGHKADLAGHIELEALGSVTEKGVKESVGRMRLLGRRRGC